MIVCINNRDQCKNGIQSIQTQLRVDFALKLTKMH